MDLSGAKEDSRKVRTMPVFIFVLKVGSYLGIKHIEKENNLKIRFKKKEKKGILSKIFSQNNMILIVTKNIKIFLILSSFPD